MLRLVSRGISRSADRTSAPALIVASSLRATASATREEKAKEKKKRKAEREEKEKRNAIEDDKSSGPRRDGCNKRDGRPARRVTAIEITRLILGACYVLRQCGVTVAEKLGSSGALNDK